MAVGLPMKTTYANGDVYSASDVNDITGTVNLIGQTNNFYAGKNKIINGDFYVNQRNFTSNTNGAYGFDRWGAYVGTDGTVTQSAQTFTPGTAPVAGYEGRNYLRVVSTGQASAGSASLIIQQIENVRTLANSNVTVSFWAKAGTGTPKIAVELQQQFGTGGSPSSPVNTYAGQVTLSTSWARYSVTVALPSISGKTIGTDANSSSVGCNLWLSAGTTFNSRTGSLGIQSATIELWGVQVESGSTATAFQTATGTIQGELAACQRYYLRYSITAAPAYFLNGVARGGTVASCYFPSPVEMRIVPSSIDVSGFRIYSFSAGLAYTGGTTTLEAYNNKIFQINYTHGSSVFTTGTNILGGFDATSSYIGFSAEL